jgi:hypothetical protein
MQVESGEFFEDLVGGGFGPDEGFGVPVVIVHGFYLRKGLLNGVEIGTVRRKNRGRGRPRPRRPRERL